MKYFVSLLPAYRTARISKNTLTGLIMAINTLPSSPTELRNMIRNGRYDTITAGLAPGYVQTNLPRDLAFDFLLFCQRNPKPCPLIEVIESGNIEPKLTAPGADIRTDIPKYRIYRDGVLDEEVENVLDVWRDDLVSFLLGWYGRGSGRGSSEPDYPTRGRVVCTINCVWNPPFLTNFQ